MRFWTIAVSAAAGALVAYAALQAPAFRTAERAPARADGKQAEMTEEAKAAERQRQARLVLVREECGEDDRCSATYRRAIDAWDACRARHANLPPSCAAEYDAAVAKAKSFSAAKPGHEH